MNKDILKIPAKTIGIISALYLFLVGIAGMSTAIGSITSELGKTVLTPTNDNPFIALFIGIFATVLFQSSSTTTSLIVAMVSSGSLSIEGSIPMIMGANVGTTVTNTIVSIGHINKGTEFKRAFAASTVHDFFNIMAVIIIFPIEIIFHPLKNIAKWFALKLYGTIDTDVLQDTSPIKTAVKTGAEFIQKFTFDDNIIYLILSVTITFLMLYSIVKLLKSLVLKKIEGFFDQYIFNTAIKAMLFGVILTIMVQSSSITTALVVPLAGAGVLTLRQIFPFTLGANIGTTVTALLAAVTGTVSALVAGFSHLLFNIFGILIIYGIPLLRRIPLALAENIANTAISKKYVPILYLLTVFVLIPLCIIYFGR